MRPTTDVLFLKVHHLPLREQPLLVGCVSFHCFLHAHRNIHTPTSTDICLFFLMGVDYAQLFFFLLHYGLYIIVNV